MPVEVLGANTVPEAGDDFYVLESEAEVRSIAERRSRTHRLKTIAERAKSSGLGPLTMENFSEKVSAGEVRELPVIVKGDVQGSVEALSNALLQIGSEAGQVKIIHKGAGAVSENDIQLAIASNALVIGFNVRADARASALAELEGVRILYSRVIYELVDAVKEFLLGLQEPEKKETTLGRVEVRQTFKVPRIGVIAGSYVLDGVVQRGALVRLLRDNRVIYEGKMGSLRRFKDDVREVAAGYECGIGIEGYNDLKDGDIIEVYKIESVQRGSALVQ
jgi:translation initiation factor IF-2